MLTPAQVSELLQPYLPVSTDLAAQLVLYLELLLKWNARTNLTSIKDPEKIVTRHFGESLFLAQHLGPCATLLDFGSGAGFPGLPIQLLRPELHVTLAESQNKKSAFLHEAIRALNVRAEVHAARVEDLPLGRIFDVVTLRAVDKMESTLAAAVPRVARRLALFITGYPTLPHGFLTADTIDIPNSINRRLLLADRV